MQTGVRPAMPTWLEIDNKDSSLKVKLKSPSPEKPKMRVLIVEDHDDTRFMLKTALEFYGFAVLEALDGNGAILAAENETPDLILMDFSLPVCDGLAATKHIRANAALQDVPIIFLSGRAEALPQREALAAGCTDYLCKPVEIDHMMLLIHRYLGTTPASNGR